MKPTEMTNLWLACLSSDEYNPVSDWPRPDSWDANKGLPNAKKMGVALDGCAIDDADERRLRFCQEVSIDPQEFSRSRQTRLARQTWCS